MQIKAIEENKVSRKTKCGIISFVHKFEVSSIQFPCIKSLISGAYTFRSCIKDMH